MTIHIKTEKQIQETQHIVKKHNCHFHGSYYYAEFIFPGFPKQNELFSLTNLFMRNTNVGFQLLAITLETMTMG